MRREFDPRIPEMMDRPQPVTRELRDDLDALEWLNRTFGAHRYLRHFLTRHFRGHKTIRMLDLATGSADLPRVAAAWGRARDIPVTVDALDSHPSTLAIARERCAGFPEITLERHDIREPWMSERYDLVTCFLALHHFTEWDAARVLRVMRQSSSAFTLAVDLERSRVADWAIRLLTATLLTAPMTRHDARLSIRRAFSHREFRALARTASWPSPRHNRVFLFRQAIHTTRPGSGRGRSPRDGDHFSTDRPSGWLA